MQVESAPLNESIDASGESNADTDRTLDMSEFCSAKAVEIVPMIDVN